VKIIGMTNLDEVDPADESRTYRQKPYWRRMSVAVAGSAMHFAMALLLFFVIFVWFGRADAENWVIAELSDPTELEESLGPDERFIASMQEAVDAGEVPASVAGLQPGDRIESGDGVAFATFDDLATFVRERPGETVAFVIEDADGGRRTVETTIGGIANTELEATVGFLGVSPERPLSTLGPVDAAGESLQTFGETVSQSVVAIGRFFSPSGISGFIDNAFTADEPAIEPSGATPSGPAVDEADENRLISIYGAVRLGGEATEEGLVQLFAFLALLNIFIGVFNLVPLLPLDGGHVAVATYERVREIGRGRRYHADITKLLPLTYAVVFVLVTIGMIALYVDITDPVTIR
jgi:membrane-associated protease RseP (regulator of RpoE activity)